MELFYFKAKKGNFGDDLNAWLWDRLLPGWQQWDDRVTLIGVGTLINQQNLNRFKGRRILVLGTGAGYDRPLRRGLDPKWDFRAVRGPASARSLHLSEEVGLIDPAVMISGFPEFASGDKAAAPLFIPHHETMERHPWSRICGNVGVDFVSPREDAVSVIKAISRAPLVLAESMHAAILADSFRVPWIPVRIGKQFNAQKWSDFFESTSCKRPIQVLYPYHHHIPYQIGPISFRTMMNRLLVAREAPTIEHRLEAVLNTPSFLSDAGVLEDRMRKFEAVLEGVRQDYGRH